MKRLLLAFTLAAFAYAGWGATRIVAIAQATPARHIVDAAAVARINETLRQMTSDGTIVGVSALVFEHDREVYFGAFGDADREAHSDAERSPVACRARRTRPAPARCHGLDQ